MALAQKDISDIKDIQLLVDTFYTEVKKDTTIGPIFNEVAHFDWETHIPIMYTFWDSILFGTATYNGNPMTKHIELSYKTEMSDVQFNTWLQIWTDTVDYLFKGQKADEAKSRAASISVLMLHKIKQDRL